MVGCIDMLREALEDYSSVAVPALIIGGLGSDAGEPPRFPENMPTIALSCWFAVSICST